MKIQVLGTLAETLGGVAVSQCRKINHKNDVAAHQVLGTPAEAKIKNVAPARGSSVQISQMKLIELYWDETSDARSSEDKSTPRKGEKPESVKE